MTSEADAALTWGAQFAHAERILAAGGSATAGDEARMLLGSLLGVPTALLLARPASRISRSDVETYADWVSRRAAGEAIPHITGHLAFMGLDLRVERDVPLVPPGAQRLVNVALDCARHGASGKLSAAEIGTGCGAVALALAAFEPRFAQIYAVDASASALRVATANGARYLLNLVITWLEGDGPGAVPEPVDLIVCGRWGQCEDATAPQFARLLEQAPAKLRPGGAFVCGLQCPLGALAAELFGHAFRGAQVWAEPAAEGAVVAVALAPRPPQRPRGIRHQEVAP